MLPVTLAAALLLIVAGHVSFWNLRTVAGLGAFAVLLVAVSLLVSIRVDVFTLPRRKKRGKVQFLNRADPWSRLVKFVLGGVVIPIAAFVAANKIDLGNHQTPMSLAIHASHPERPPTGAEMVAQAVIGAESPAVRIEGIRALQAMASTDALDQLFRILARGPSTLSEGGVSVALATALASYGAQAEPRLLQLLRETPPSVRRVAGGPPGGLFDRYFDGAFDGVTAEVESRALEPAARQGALARVQAARAELQRTMARVEGDTGETGAGVPSLVMQALLAMKLDRAPDLLAFAREAAADVTWSDAVRGQALLLTAKLGSAADLEFVYGYVQSPSAALQAYAMRAVAELQAKGSATTER